MTNKKLIGVRDPFGIRPLVIGKLKKTLYFTSETCALDIMGILLEKWKMGKLWLLKKN